MVRPISLREAPAGEKIRIAQQIIGFFHISFCDLLTDSRTADILAFVLFFLNDHCLIAQIIRILL